LLKERDDVLRESQRRVRGRPGGGVPLRGKNVFWKIRVGRGVPKDNLVQTRIVRLKREEGHLIHSSSKGGIQKQGRF